MMTVIRLSTSTPPSRTLRVSLAKLIATSFGLRSPNLFVARTARAPVLPLVNELTLTMPMASFHRLAACQPGPLQYCAKTSGMDGDSALFRRGGAGAGRRSGVSALPLVDGSAVWTLTETFTLPSRLRPEGSLPTGRATANAGRRYHVTTASGHRRKMLTRLELQLRRGRAGDGGRAGRRARSPRICPSSADAGACRCTPPKRPASGRSADLVAAAAFWVLHSAFTLLRLRLHLPRSWRRRLFAVHSAGVACLLVVDHVRRAAYLKQA